MQTRCIFHTLFWFLLLGTASLHAQVQIGPVWTGAGADNNWTTPGNWLNGTVPAAGSDLFYSYALGDFSTNLTTSTTLNSLDLSAASLYPDYNYGYHYDTYRFSSPGPVTLAIGAGGLISNNVFVDVSSSISISLTASQTWYIYDGSDPVRINGTLTDNGNTLTLDGYGSLILNGSNNLTGTIDLQDGALVLGNNNALGTATINATYGILQSSGNITINNPIIITEELDLETTGGALTLSGPITSSGTGYFPYIYVHGRNPVNLTGALTLNSPFELDVDAASTVTMSGHVVASASPQSVSLYDGGTVILNGIVDPTAVSEYYVYDGKLIFGSLSAVPSGATKIAVQNSASYSYEGYAGLGVAGVTASSFLSAFDKPNSSGTIGFDNGITIAGPVDLTGFNATARLGSATTATLGPGAVITPQGTSYNFGGGGGTLVVASNLTGANSLSLLSSSIQPLTLELSGTNSFTGGTTIDNSVLRFDNASAFPTSGTFSLQPTGYPNYFAGHAYVGFGYNVDLSTPTASGGLAARFSVPAGSGLVVGFDSPGVTSIAGTIDLSPFPTGTFLGTSTSLTVSGPLVGPGGGTLNLAAVKDGHLTVASALSGNAGVVIGLPGADYFPNPDSYGDSELYNSDYLHKFDDGVVDFSDARSTVTLTGNNSGMTGVVTLQGGRLEVGNNQALGTGQLGVNGDSVFAASSAGLNIPNDIYVYNGALGLDSTAHDFTLSGPLGGNAYVKLGTGTVNVTGDASINYYVRVEQGTLDVSSASYFSDRLYVNAAGIVNFHTADPSVYYLFGDAGGAINLDPGTTLEVQSGGYYAGTLAGGGGLSFSFGGLLELAGVNTYSGGTTISGGTLLTHVNGGLGTGPVTLLGGELDLGRGVTLTNTLTIFSGALGGHGTFSPASGPITIGTNVAVSPGLINTSYSSGSVAGALTFGSNLTFAPQGAYIWALVDASNVAGSGWGLVNVNGTLTITSTPGSPFFISLLPGGFYYNDYTYIYNFPLDHPYSWTIATASGGIVGFNAADFSLDTTNFATLFADYPLANFNLVQNGNSLVLNFDPVPEPSTYALMIAGLGVVALPVLRRRRRG